MKTLPRPLLISDDSQDCGNAGSNAFGTSRMKSVPRKLGLVFACMAMLVFAVACPESLSAESGVGDRPAGGNDMGKSGCGPPNYRCSYDGEPRRLFQT